MNKIKMIASAFIVFAALGSALAFSPANQFAYNCNTNLDECEMANPGPVFAFGDQRANAVTTQMIKGRKCELYCPESAQFPYSAE